jgi:hypothetical protein
VDHTTFASQRGDKRTECEPPRKKKKKKKIVRERERGNLASAHGETIEKWAW